MLGKVKKTKVDCLKTFQSSEYLQNASKGAMTSTLSSHLKSNLNASVFIKLNQTPRHSLSLLLSVSLHANTASACDNLSHGALSILRGTLHARYSQHLHPQHHSTLLAQGHLLLIPHTLHLHNVAYGKRQNPKHFLCKLCGSGIF